MTVTFEHIHTKQLKKDLQGADFFQIAKDNNLDLEFWKPVDVNYTNA